MTQQEETDPARPAKQWAVTRYPRTPDVCDVNQAQGPIRNDRPFQSGHDAPPAHPRCVCNLIMS